MTTLVNKKEGRLKLPKSTNWMVYDLKERIRRVKLEMKRNDLKVTSYLKHDLEEMSHDLQVLRQLESDYVQHSNKDTNEGRKRHQYKRIQESHLENDNYNHWILNRSYMRKQYKIDKGITIYRGDVYISKTAKDNSEVFIVQNLTSIVTSGEIGVNLERRLTGISNSSCFYTVDLNHFANNFNLLSVFTPDFSGALPNQCPSCEDEIYYENGGFHAYTF